MYGLLYTFHLLLVIVECQEQLLPSLPTLKWPPEIFCKVVLDRSSSIETFNNHIKLISTLENILFSASTETQYLSSDKQHIYYVVQGNSTMADMEGKCDNENFKGSPAILSEENFKTVLDETLPHIGNTLLKISGTITSKLPVLGTKYANSNYVVFGEGGRKYAFTTDTVDSILCKCKREDIKKHLTGQLHLLKENVQSSLKIERNFLAGMEENLKAIFNTLGETLEVETNRSIVYTEKYKYKDENCLKVQASLSVGSIPTIEGVINPSNIDIQKKRITKALEILGKFRTKLEWLANQLSGSENTMEINMCKNYKSFLDILRNLRLEQLQDTSLIILLLASTLLPSLLIVIFAIIIYYSNAYFKTKLGELDRTQGREYYKVNPQPSAPGLLTN